MWTNIQHSQIYHLRKQAANSLWNSLPHMNSRINAFLPQMWDNSHSVQSGETKSMYRKQSGMSATIKTRQCAVFTSKPTQITPWHPFYLQHEANAWRKRSHICSFQKPLILHVKYRHILTRPAPACINQSLCICAHFRQLTLWWISFCPVVAFLHAEFIICLQNSALSSQITQLELRYSSEGKELNNSFLDKLTQILLL